MKKTKLRLLLLLFFIGGLIILPQKAKAAEMGRRKLEPFLI